MKNILFDMDGTLYSFENGQYKGSKLESEVQFNATKILKSLEGDNFLQKFEEIKSRYGEEFSLAFEELYKIKKEDYFNKVWDIYPDKFILNNKNVLEVFTYLKGLGYDIYLVSESPLIWINRVLFFLKIKSLLSGIYSGQGNERKSNGLLYEKVKSNIGSNHYMVGDQITSDIIMSKKSGFKPIYISDKQELTDEAEYNITLLTDLCDIVK